MCNSRFSFVLAVVLATTAVVVPAAAQLGRGKTAAAPAATTTEQPAEQPLAAGEQPAPVSHLTLEQVREQVRGVVREEGTAYASAQGLKLVNQRLGKLEGKVENHVYIFLTGIVLVVLFLAFRFVFRHFRDDRVDHSHDHVHPDHAGFGRLGFMIILSLIGLLIFALSASAAPTCFNAETGKTAGSQKVAVAVINASNTFSCSINGKVVELVNPDTPATVVVTPSVTKNSPLEFNFTPAAEGRLVIKVDGKVYNQLAVRDEKTAISINDAIDLVGPAPSSATSGVDTHVRLLLEGLACPTGDASCLAAFRRQAWGAGRGTSSQAGAAIHGGIINATLGDPRLKSAIEGGMKAAIAALPPSTTPAPASVDLSEVDRRIDKLEADHDSLGRRVDSAAAQAAEAKTTANAASAAAFSAQQSAGQLKQLLAERGPRGVRKALKTPPPAAAPAPSRQKGAAFTRADQK